MVLMHFGAVHLDQSIEGSGLSLGHNDAPYALWKGMSVMIDWIS